MLLAAYPAKAVVATLQHLLILFLKKEKICHGVFATHNSSNCTKYLTFR